MIEKRFRAGAQILESLLEYILHRHSRMQWLRLVFYGFSAGHSESRPNRLLAWYVFSMHMKIQLSDNYQQSSQR
jgi:hypothetical protein